MAYDFPASPSLGQIFVPTAGGPQWTWNGTAWTSSGGSSLGMQIIDTIFLSSGTYTPGNGVLYADAQCWGAGGAGGGAVATGASTLAVGGGGNAGAWAFGSFTAAQLGASQVITIGTGGTGVAGNAGGNGGSTSFGSLVVAAGGPGGSYVAASVASIIAVPLATVQSSAGSIQGSTQVGSAGIATNVNGYGGSGGQSSLGGGGYCAAVATGAAGGSTGGAGGRAAGGAGSINAFSQAARPGGAGGNGLCWVREYYSFAGTAPAPGTIIERFYTSSGTWTNPAGLMVLEVEIQSAGGGGGGCAITAASQFAASGGGGGGAWARQLFTAASLGSSVAYTVGAIGTGGVGNASGTAGGTCAFSTLSVAGGQGGGGAASVASGSYPGAGGGSASGDNLGGTLRGQRGMNSYLIFSAGVVYSGQGANSMFGMGGNSIMGATADGQAGLGFGTGGSGGVNLASVAATRTGGNGTPAFIKVREFY